MQDNTGNDHKYQSQNPIGGESLSEMTSTLQHDLTFPQTVDMQAIISETRERVRRAVKTGTFISAESSDELLRGHLNSKLKLIVLYVDLVGSTMMTRSLPVAQLALMVQTFTQEMSFTVSRFNGYVLKYVGDAVIAYFPADANYNDKCNAAINCSDAMIQVLEEGINSVFREHDYEGLQAKIGIESGEHSVIQYILGSNPHVDVLGYGISMAAKLSTLARPNQVVISHGIYFGMHPSFRKKFVQMDLDPQRWKYIHERFQPGVWRSLPLEDGE
ncbi:MAG: adenylate/guanylate cyclase domain-containing protein [Thermoproteota archaeon]|nr:adenylate/guanylate cyclase domain-containing protein [Thermoproteota archaeon]